MVNKEILVKLTLRPLRPVARFLTSGLTPTPTLTRPNRNPNPYQYPNPNGQLLNPYPNPNPIDAILTRQFSDARLAGGYGQCGARAGPRASGVITDSDTTPCYKLGKKCTYLCHAQCMYITTMTAMTKFSSVTELTKRKESVHGQHGAACHAMTMHDFICPPATSRIWVIGVNARAHDKQ